jgi:hypothetical protein
MEAFLGLVPQSQKRRNLKLYNVFIGFLLLCIIFIAFTNKRQMGKSSGAVKLTNPNNLTPKQLRNKRGPPYLTYILSSVPRRFNFTVKSLTSGLPGFFNINRKQPVSLNDSRIYHHGNPKYSSVLLTYVDLLTDIGSKSEAELTYNDWVFIFEDDANIVPAHVIRTSFGKIYAKWNSSYPYPKLAGIVLSALSIRCF